MAAFLAEPVPGVGGVIVPPDDYFPLVRAICDRAVTNLLHPPRDLAPATTGQKMVPS